MLRLDPEIAVRRRHDEPSRYVRNRNQEVYDADWSGTNAVVVDATLPPHEVLDVVRRIVWERL